MIRKKGDLVRLFEKEFFDIIAHGCNCMGIMGAGIAKQIAEKYPNALSVDIEHKSKFNNPTEQMGTFSVLNIGDYKRIYNLYTQIKPGKHFDFESFKLALKAMKNDLPCSHTDSKIRIGFPYIGCGLGGFESKELIEKTIKDELNEYDIYIVEYEKTN
jgi:O-acetyl-ADP-ribose deacetylase (regulator of RNase III)